MAGRLFLRVRYLGSAADDLLAQLQQGLRRQLVGADGELLSALHVDEASGGAVAFRHSKVGQHVRKGGADVDGDEEDLTWNHRGQQLAPGFSSGPGVLTGDSLPCP